MICLINCIKSCFSSSFCGDQEAHDVVLEVSKNQDVANAALNHLNHVRKDMSIPELTVETPENRLLHPTTDQNKRYLGSHSVSKRNSYQPEENRHNPDFLFPEFRPRPSRSGKGRNFVAETDVLEDDFPFDGPGNEQNDIAFSSRLYLPSAVADPEETFTDETEFSVRSFD